MLHRETRNTPQLEALPGTFRKGEVLIQAGTAALASTLPGEERVGSGAPGELFVLTAAHGWWQEGMFFRRNKKETYFINDKDDDLRHCLHCLASEQLVEIGVSEALLCPLGFPAQAYNTHSMRKCHKSPNKTREILHFSALSAVYYQLLLSLGLQILISAQGKVLIAAPFPLCGFSAPPDTTVAGHRQLQLEHKTIKQIKARSSFPESSFAVPHRLCPALLCAVCPQKCQL